MRDLLTRADRRFRDLARRPPAPAVTLESLFAAELAKVRADPACQAFDPDAERATLALVREHKIADVSVVFARIGGEARREALLRFCERHPNLKAHPAPRPRCCNGGFDADRHRTDAGGPRPQLSGEMARRRAPLDAQLRPAGLAPRAEPEVPQGGGSARQLADGTANAAPRRARRNLGATA